MQTYTKQASRFTVTRTLHCIDAENLSGASLVLAPRLSAMYANYREHVEVGPMDQTIVSASHYNALAVGVSWPEGRYRWRSGENGADLELISAVKDQVQQSKFDRVVLASGDGIFGDLVVWLKSRGIHVTVVGLAGAISTNLRFLADKVVVLDGVATRTFGMGA